MQEKHQKVGITRAQRGADWLAVQEAFCRLNTPVTFRGAQRFECTVHGLTQSHDVLLVEFVFHVFDH